MPLYLVSYDSTEQNPEDYQPFWDYLKARDARRVLDSQWAITEAGFDAERRLHDAFRLFLKKEDRLLITEITKQSHGSNLRVGDADFKALLQYAR